MQATIKSKVKKSGETPKATITFEEMTLGDLTALRNALETHNSPGSLEILRQLELAILNWDH